MGSETGMVLMEVILVLILWYFKECTLWYFIHVAQTLT